MSESAATLGVEVSSCSVAGSSGYNTGTSNLVLTMGSVTSLVFGVVNGYVTVNGYSCVKPAGTKITPAMVKKITITGTGGADKVVLDTLSGPLGATILAATGGISIDLAAGTDTFSIRGSSGIDKWAAGVVTAAMVTDLFLEISGDTTADIKVVGGENVNVSLSSGADTFTGMGGTFTATHLSTGPITTLTPVTLNMAINGGDGDDVITGGIGDDTINGGAGADTFKASAVVAMVAPNDGDDTFYGGAGTDKADYSARTGDLTVVMDGATNSGDLLLETDLIDDDVEDFVGGAGADTLTGNALGNHIQGGAGDDTISGGPAGNCTAAPIDADVLDGEGDNDIFDQGSAADCGDVLNGGAGTDRVDYQGRAQDLNISIDGTANDGNPAAGTGEKDNVKGDVEIVISGSGDDTVIGSANADELHGGPGADTVNGGAANDVLSGDSGDDILNGEAGDDTFDESGVDPEYTVAENKGDDDDIINGGTHDTLGLDTLDYSARVALKPVTVTICMDATKLTGNSALAALTYPMCSDSDGAVADTEADQVVNVTHLIGGLGDDVLTGHTGDDIIEGGAGDDQLFGDVGNDALYGDDGVDTMDGEAGDDTLDGNDTDSDADVYDGGAGEGDICIVASGETPTNCEL